MDDEWTQEEAVAYDCACAAIGSVISILSWEIHQEKSKPQPDAKRLESLLAEQLRLHLEREDLHVGEHEKIAQVRKKYGEFVRNWDAENHARLLGSLSN